MINYVKNRAVAAATEIVDGLNYTTDNETHSNVELMNKQVILLNFTLISVMSTKFQSCSSSSSSTENYKLTELKKSLDIKIAISEKEDFEHELLNCGYNVSGMSSVVSYHISFVGFSEKSHYVFPSSIKLLKLLTHLTSFRATKSRCFSLWISPR